MIYMKVNMLSPVPLLPNKNTPLDYYSKSTTYQQYTFPIRMSYKLYCFLHSNILEVKLNLSSNSYYPSAYCPNLFSFYLGQSKSNQNNQKQVQEYNKFPN